MRFYWDTAMPAHLCLSVATFHYNLNVETAGPWAKIFTIRLFTEKFGTSDIIHSAAPMQSYLPIY